MTDSKNLWITLYTLIISMWVTTAQADETHYENFRFGQTAMGFGGAVTGFLSEPEATFYNPGGLAFLGVSKFSGAMNFLGRDKRVIRDFVSLDESDVPTQDGYSQDILTLPTSSVIVKSFFEGKHVIAFSTFLLSETRDNFSANLDVEEDTQRLRLGYTEQLDDRIILIGPSYAVRLSPNISLGMSIFYARRTYSVFDQVTERIIKPEIDSVPVGYTEIHERVDTQEGGVLMKIGALWRVNSRWSLGGIVSTPAIQFYGRGTYTFRYIDATPSDLIDGDEDNDNDIERFYEDTTEESTFTQYPWMIGLGTSYGKPGAWRLAVSMNLYLPLTYTRIELDDDDAAEEDFTGFITQVERELTINAAIGGEYYMSPQWPIRMGLFTNHASSPELNQPRTMTPRLSHVDLYGGSLSVGYEDGNASINFGVEAQIGSGYETTLDSELNTEVDELFRRREREQYRALFFISGALNFVSTKAKDLIKVD
jgi:long-chain fatty acid transport protein